MILKSKPFPIVFLFQTHLKWLINWCCSNLYLEGSYAQRHLAILTLHWLIHLHGSDGIQTVCRELQIDLFSDKKI